jgi:uncharacterized protein (DUF1501 family)
MNRKEFLRLTSKAAIGTPFLLNGMTAQVLNNYIDMPMLANNVNDRVLVIVRLAGANDGLNTVIPISQYSNYQILRPNIHIKDTGVNKYIELDTTLQSDKLSGLHPTLTGFKDLYDSGKMAVVNGVGYPTPNFSHFQSQNTMFAGKDGTNNTSLNSGMFGRYLAALYPGLANNPTPDKQDPMAIQFGTTNPCMFYGHDHEIGIEYNATSLETGLFNQLSMARSMNTFTSEYDELLQYIQATEKVMDVYYNRIQNVFNAGVNSATSYPDTSLAKQLKTVARMIKGGSKTKIFQVTLGGFDTHASQTVSGSSHTGAHANLLATMANAIKSFQTDINNLGLENKVMTVSFSEFGRRVRENGNLGTDHGSLSPFFVFGSSLNPGVYGTHPVFTNNTDFLYNDSELKYDYRQLFATLMQDWLGANDIIMQEAELSDFSTQANKIPLIKTADNAYPGPMCLGTEIITEALNSDNGWTYYGVSGTTNYLFALEHTPTGSGANTLPFTAQITINDITNCATSIFSKTLNDEGTFAIGTTWNITILTGNTDGWINLRFFNNGSNETTLTNEANAYAGSNGINNISPIMYIKTNQPLSMPSALRADGKGLDISISPLVVSQTGNYISKNYVQFNAVSSINNSGGTAIVRTSTLTQNNFQTPVSVGSLRFNSTTNKFEGWDGTNWVILNM